MSSLPLIRIALWDRKKPIVVFLGVLCLGHWGLLYRTMFVVEAKWEEDLRACVVKETKSSLLKVTFLFSEYYKFVCNMSINFNELI